MASSQKRFAIVDIETTGGMYYRDRIIEIAIVLSDGMRIIDQFDTLLDPVRSIPREITRITGINDEMVQGKPKFYEVAKEVVEWTEGAVFVAHNVYFDYRFIKHAFEDLGYPYSRKRLCTLRLGKRLFPELPSHGLDKLIRHFNLTMNSRHRALDDAVATAEFFHILLDKEKSGQEIKQFINRGVIETRLPRAISMERLHELPESCGVYYFLDTEGEIIYVGKSTNIQKRVMQHFSTVSKKSERMQQIVADIRYEVTGSELIALLLESEEIKALQPSLNRAQRTNQFPFVVYSYTDHCRINTDIL